MPGAERSARRARRRAAVRRRRALLVLAAASALAGAIAGAGAGDGGEPAAIQTYCSRSDPDELLRQAGQGVMVRMGERADAPLLRELRSGAVGGVILFPGEGVPPRRVARGVALLRRAAARAGVPPPLVAIDQEGGPVARLPGLAPQRPPYAIGLARDADAARLEGAATGFQLRELGIDVDLAPVLDVPASESHFIASRSFGSGPRDVARLGTAFARALQGEGVAATAKHFPGLGRAAENTDFAPTTVTAPARALRRDLRPFRAAVAAGVRLVMVSSASYPALGVRRPAVLSQAAVGDLLRGELGFAGVAISDDLLAPAVAASHGPARAAIAATRAGVDVKLYAARHPRGVARALAAAAAAGRLDPALVRSSCERIEQLKRELAGGEPLG